MANEEKEKSENCFEVGKSQEEKKEEKIDRLERQLLGLTKKMDFYERYAHRHDEVQDIPVRISGV